MKSPRRHSLFVLVVAALVAVFSTAPTSAHADVNVYTDPGSNFQNGRYWDTACEKYSSTVVRCRTNIWATQVTYANGRFTPKTGWHFNNLTYLPSSRTAWSNNPLGANGVVRGTAAWNSSGRRWRTECDSAATGNGGCRSYIWTTSIARTGNTYRNVEGWVFNNMVQFSTSSVNPVTQVPRAKVTSSSMITPDGVGPLRVGMSASALTSLGYGTTFRSNACFTYLDSPELSALGIFAVVDQSRSRVTSIHIEKDGPRTLEGAHVGVSFGQLWSLYGGVPDQDPTARLVSEDIVRNGSFAGASWAYALRQGATKTLFITGSSYYQMASPLGYIVILPANGMLPNTEGC